MWWSQVLRSANLAVPTMQYVFSRTHIYLKRKIKLTIKRFGESARWSDLTVGKANSMIARKDNLNFNIHSGMAPGLQKKTAVTAYLKSEYTRF